MDKNCVIATVLFVMLSACQTTIKIDENPVAKVYDEYLTRKEVLDFIPVGTPKDDSLLIADSYVRNWVTKKLMLHKALENLSDTKEIEKQVEEYKTSLIIHQYKQNLIQQQFIANITDEEQLSYYESHKDGFILPTTIVKTLMFIIPKTVTDIKKVRKWFLSDSPKDMEELENYCFTKAVKYDNFDNNWVEVKYLLNLWPGNATSNMENEIFEKTHIEKEDDNNYYFMIIKEICKEQTTSPFEYVQNEIKLILKNQKRLEFETNLEKEINDEAQIKNYVKIY